MALNRKSHMWTLALSPALAFACIAPALAQSSFTEDFSANTLPARFEQTGPVDTGPVALWGGHGPVFEFGGVGSGARFPAGLLRFPAEVFLRTAESDYAAYDFVAEVTVTNTVSTRSRPRHRVLRLRRRRRRREPGIRGAEWQGIRMGVSAWYHHPGVGVDDGYPIRRYPGQPRLRQRPWRRYRHSPLAPPVDGINPDCGFFRHTATTRASRSLRTVHSRLWSATTTATPQRTPGFTSAVTGTLRSTTSSSSSTGRPPPTPETTSRFVPATRSIWMAALPSTTTPRLARCSTRGHSRPLPV